MADLFRFNEHLAAIDARIAAAAFNDDPAAVAEREQCLRDEGWTAEVAAVLAHAPEDLPRLRAALALALEIAHENNGAAEQYQLVIDDLRAVVRDVLPFLEIHTGGQGLAARVRAALDGNHRP